MLLVDYANQNIVWKQKQGTNDFNDPIYSSSNIMARFVYKRKMITDRYGQEKISEAQCYTLCPVKTDDVLVFDNIDWVVQRVTNVTGFDGKVEHYEVML